MKQCIFWDHLKFWDMFIEKIPEWVIMCLDCADKHRDDKIYKWSNEWRAVWQYGIWYFKWYADRRWKNPKIKNNLS